MTAVSTLVKKLEEGTATKDDEVQILDQIAKAADEGAMYLAALLTPELIGWVRAQLKADLWPNIMERIDTEVDRRAKAEATAIQLGLDLETVHTANKKLAGDLKHEKAGREADAENAQAAFQDLVDRHKLATDAHNDTMEELMLAERRLRAVRHVAGDAWLDNADPCFNHCSENRVDI